MEQRSDEWYAARLGCVSASRLYDVVKKNKDGSYSAARRNYMAELIAERLSGVNAEKFTSRAMEWGTEWEPMARSAYEAYTGNLVIETGFVKHPTIPHFGASPDGLIGDHGLLEIKDPQSSTHIDTILTTILDPRYISQMTAQASCTGRSWCDFVSFDPRFSDDFQLFITRVQIADTDIQAIESEVVKFLADLETLVDKIFSIRPKGKETYIERWRI